MSEFWDIAIPIIALFGSIALAGVLLTRARSHAKPETPEGTVQMPATVTKRQRRIIEALEPAPQIPTLMDLVRQEVAELGLAEVPGAEGISDGVLLKVYRRDESVRDRCTHDSYGYVVAEGVNPADALDADVRLSCDECEEEGTNTQDEPLQ